ncbi:MAG: oligosaccharide flippase family protein [Ferruginibacter sp.]
MLKQLKQLGNDSLIYGLSGIVTRMIGVFLIPVYTRLFLPNDYGIINLVNTSFFLIGMLVVCALDNSASRWFYDSKEIKDHKKTFGSWIWFQFILSSIIAVIIIILSPYLVNIFFKQDGKPMYFILPAITLVTNMLPGVINNWYRLHRRPVATVAFSISQTIVTIGLSVLFVIVLRWHIAGVFAALAVSSFIFSLVALQQMHGWLNIKYFSKARLKPMLKYALPFIPAAIAYWLLNSTDSYFLAYFKDNAEVGLFGIGASLAAGISLLTGAFQQAWGPFAFSIMNDDNAKHVYANVFLLFGYTMGFVAASVMLFAPEILMLLTAPAYYDAAWVAGILGYNLVLIGFTYIASIGISIAKVSAPYGYAMLFATILTIILDIILIPKFGKEGSAIATVAAQLIVPGYLFYKSHKVYPVPYKYAEVLLVIAVMAFVVIIVRLIGFNSLAMQITAKVITTVVLLVVAIIVNKSKLQIILSGLKKKKVVLN